MSEKETPNACEAPKCMQCGSQGYPKTDAGSCFDVYACAARQKAIAWAAEGSEDEPDDGIFAASPLPTPSKHNPKCPTGKGEAEDCAYCGTTPSSRVVLAPHTCAEPPGIVNSAPEQGCQGCFDEGVTFGKAPLDAGTVRVPGGFVRGGGSNTADLQIMTASPTPSDPGPICGVTSADVLGTGVTWCTMPAGHSPPCFVGPPLRSSGPAPGIEERAQRWLWPYDEYEPGNQNKTLASLIALIEDVRRETIEACAKLCEGVGDLAKTPDGQIMTAYCAEACRQSSPKGCETR